MLFSLPTEVQLDIFKLFNYEELCSFRNTNLYFRNFINKFEGELAREKFETFSIEYFDNTLSKRISYKLFNSRDFDFAFFAERHKEVNEQIEQKWSEGLQNPISLYLSDEGLESSNAVICIDKDDDNKTPRIVLELPTIIKCKKDIKIVYYYLNKLFNCSFYSGFLRKFTFNLELIELLFGKTPKLFFYGSMFKAYNTENLLKFVSNSLISGIVDIKFPHVNNTEEYKKILYKIFLNGDKFGGVSLSFDEMPELFDFVINVSFFVC
ncbi:unnamed protein product [Meloidogyne enterolobii]|uniref:Uncharacterized protein n=1 Tax=Meloidogyne enterolobii TaxID=390850 RepID=A0ACB0Z8Q4_MELEN